MKEYISRGDFTSDTAFNRYKSVLKEYGNVKEVTGRLNMEIINIQNQIKSKTPFSLLDKKQYLLNLEYIRDGLT